MKYKTKISVLILVLSVFVLTTVFLFACGNETDKKDGIDTTTPESTATTISTEVTASPEVTTAPKSETTAPETTVSQTEEVTTAPVPEKTDIRYFLTRFKAKPTDSLEPKYDVIKTAGEYTAYRDAHLSDYVDGNAVFAEAEKRLLVEVTDAFFEQYYLVSVSVRAYCSNSYNYSDPFLPAKQSISITKDSLIFGCNNSWISAKSDNVFRTFYRIDKKYYRDQIKIEYEASDLPNEFVGVPYSVEQSAMLYDTSDGHVGQTPLAYGIYLSVEDLKNDIKNTRVEPGWKNEAFEKTVPEIFEKYDEEFFKTHIILGMDIHLPNDNVFLIEDVSVFDSKLYVDIKYTPNNNGPQYVYDMVVDKIYTFIEVAKKDLPDGFLDEKYPSYKVTTNFHVDGVEMYSPTDLDKYYVKTVTVD